jgi:hypothetical protein
VISFLVDEGGTRKLGAEKLGGEATIGGGTLKPVGGKFGVIGTTFGGGT